jgi:hypothetical protein
MKMNERKRERFYYLVTPRYMDAPLEKPLLFLKFITNSEKHRA